MLALFFFARASSGGKETGARLSRPTLSRISKPNLLHRTSWIESSGPPGGCGASKNRIEYIDVSVGRGQANYRIEGSHDRKGRGGRRGRAQRGTRAVYA